MAVVQDAFFIPDDIATGLAIGMQLDQIRVVL